MTTTQSPDTAPGAPDPSQSEPDSDVEPGRGKKVLKRGVTVLTVLFACIGAVSTSGYTIKDDLVPYLRGLRKKDASYEIKNPAPSDQPAIVKRCTPVSVLVRGDLPADAELWLGTNLQGRKAIVEEMDAEGNGTYRGSLAIGREKDHDQQRELDVVLVDPDAADWLRSIKDKRSLYDVASGKWLPGAHVVARMDVRRDAVTSELDCKGKK